MATDARFSFHPLIAEWLKLRVDDKARDEYVEEAINVVRLFVDNGDKKEMPIRDKGEILSHLDAVIAGDELLHKNGHQVSKTLQDAMVSFGSFYRRLGRYTFQSFVPSFEAFCETYFDNIKSFSQVCFGQLILQPLYSAQPRPFYMCVQDCENPNSAYLGQDDISRDIF